MVTGNKLILLVLLIVFAYAEMEFSTRRPDDVGVPAGPGITENASVQRVDLRKPQRRRPLRVVLAAQQQRLLVANRDSGTVSLLDIETRKVIDEWKVASRIGDMVAWGRRILVSEDASPGRLLCLSLNQQGDLEEVWRRDTVNWPSRIVVTEDGAGCIVGGLWSRQIARHSLNFPDDASPDSKAMFVQKDLGFCVGDLLLLDQQSGLLVADAFGGEWISLDSRDLARIHAGDLGSQRICGMSLWHDDAAAPASKVALVTQPLNRLAQAVRNDVHWGLMVGNDMVIKDPRYFLDPDWQEPRWTTIPLGGPGEAKGDPESIAISSRGEVALAIGGVHQVAIGDLHDRSFAYVSTGARPVDVCFDSTGRTLFVANQLDDSVTLINVEECEIIQTIPLGNVPQPTALDRGERLFFDAHISHDGWMSCHSCHVQGHTTGFLNDNFSDQSFGAPKRILSLLGHGNTAPFAWNGSAATLEAQVERSITVTMQTDDRFSKEQIADLAAFVRKLPAPPPLAAAQGNLDPDSAQAGRQLFGNLGCVECHQPEHYTIPGLRAVGVQDEVGNAEFNPPSLIGVSQRPRYFHDARYKSLTEIFAGKEAHQLNRKLSTAEMRQLIAFLNTL